MMMKTLKDNKMNVYGLFDPINKNFFYVGVSEDLKRRLLGHMSSTDKNLGKVEVIKNILKGGRRPEIRILEIVPDELFDNILKIELGWINKLIKEGHPLTNKCLTGGGIKPTRNPKKAVCLRLTQAQIDKFGGIEKLKSESYKYLLLN